MAFTAKYPDDCGDCGNDIVPGQTVTFRGDEGLVHVTCPEPKPICPRCYLEMADPTRCDNCD